MNTPATTTPDQTKAIRSADIRLQRALSGSKTPSVQAEAYAHYRYERYTQLGFEALSGPLGIYHLTEFANYVVYATRVLAHGDVGIESEKARTKATLAILAKALGFRHARGAECLWEALEGSGQWHMHGAFHELRSSFKAVAHGSMDHAFNTGSHADIAKVIWFFIDELENLTDWLDTTRTHAGAARAETILTVIGPAARKLREYEQAAGLEDGRSLM